MAASAAFRFSVTVVYGDLTRNDPVKPDQAFTREDVESIERMKAAFEEVDGLAVSALDRHDDLLPRLVDDPPGFVVNFCDTGYRNDPTHELHVPAVLEMTGVSYTGSGPACLGLCYDKATVRAVADAIGIPVPDEVFVSADAGEVAVPDRYPALVKPCTGDGSVGITADSVVDSPEDARAYATHLREQDPERNVLIQEFLPGTEYTVGLIGNPGQGTGDGIDVLPLLEVDYSDLPEDLPPILSFESKAVSSSDYWNRIGYREAEVGDELREEMVGHAKRLFRRLDCRDYARVDFRCDASGRPRLLEVNPNPAWCWDGKMNIMAGFAGHSYAEFLAMIVRAARRREGVSA